MNKSLYDYQSTQIDFPEDLADSIKEFGKRISEEDLFIDPKDPTKGRESDIHVSILYGLDNNVTADQVSDAVEGTAPITLTLGRMTAFENEEYDVLKIDRVAFAGLTKKNLPRGNWRFLTEQEIINLKNL